MNRVLIVEDSVETRLWLAGIARSAFPACEVDEAATLGEGLKRCAGRRYDLALIDLGLPDGSGLGVVRKLRQEKADTLCVVATVMGDDLHIVAALAAGAQGYLLKDQPTELLVNQLVQAAAGIPALSPPVARRIMDHFRMTGPCEEPDGTLTARETEVLGLIARGLRVADAAVALGIAEGTITSHIKTIYRKLGIGSRAEAALHAARLGLLTPEA